MAKKKLDGLSEDEIAALDTFKEPAFAWKIDKKLARSLGREEVGFLVETYYELQGSRIRSSNRDFALDGQGQPAVLPAAYAEHYGLMESKTKAILAEWVAGDPVSNWATKVCGIGPVIAAGLAAHIRIERASSPSAVWRFAGLDPTLEWHGKEGSKALIEAARKVEKEDHAALLWLAEATHRHPSSLYVAGGLEQATPEQFLKLADADDGDKANAMEALRLYPGHLDNAVSAFCERTGISEATAFAALYPGKFDWKKIGSHLGKRPWNAALKTLCWKLGDSFCKLGTRFPNSLYAKVYREEKAKRVEANAGSQYAELAAATLKKKKFSDKATRELYESGHLPDGRIDLQARRKAVKLFLSHYWTRAWLQAHPGQEAPKPWIIAHGGHIDLIPPEVPYTE